MTISSLRRFALLALSAALPSGVFAQTSQTAAGASQGNPNLYLIADSVEVSAEGVLTARGNVEVLNGDNHLQAPEIIYDEASGEIIVIGPIRLTQGDNTQILGSAAALDRDMRNGLIESARIILANETQVAASTLKRVEGRFNVLTHATAASCRVCETGRAPLWQIRAKRVVQDELERQIYFDHARLHVGGIPVFYYPRLRLPDPTLDRYRGFLIPSIRNTSLLGTGVKVPYFFPIGTDKDITLTPYIAPETNTLEFRYRQAFRKGNIHVEGALSDDTLRPDLTRGYLFANGGFGLPKSYQLSFNLRLVSDDRYLTDYDYYDGDRLESDVTISRSNRTENTRFALLHYKSTRDGEDNDTLPTRVLEAETERRFFPTRLGGELRMSLEAHAHERRSDEDGDLGRDVARANAALTWLKNWTLVNGMRVGVTSDLALDAYRTWNDSSVESFDAGITPSLAAHLRYPMAQTGSDGATYILEPVVQVAWVGGNDLDVANDESTRPEFDEGNLLALSRFPSYERRERGLSSAVGLNWSRLTSQGWEGHLTFGQIFRNQAQGDFTKTSGLADSTSDLLVAGQYVGAKGLRVTARGLIDPSGDLNKASARMGWAYKDLWLDASYVWLDSDPSEDRDDTLSEVTLDSRYRIDSHWTGTADWRFDGNSGRTAEAGLGIEYRNECVQVNLSVSRRFSTSATVQSDTSIGFNIALLGFSVNSSDKSYGRTCS